FHESKLNRLQKFATLAGEIGNDFLHASFPFGSELRFDRVLQLRPKPAQIGLQRLHRILDLRLDCLAEFRFHFRLEIVLPLLAAPNEPPRSPERKFLLKHARSLLRALTASLLDAAQKSRDLPQGLVLPHLKK